MTGEVGTQVERLRAFHARLVRVTSPRPRHGFDAADLHTDEVDARPGHAPSGCRFRIARTREDLRAAFQLVYQRYLQSGLSREIGTGMRVTPFHALPVTDTVVAVESGRVTCTMTMIRDSQWGLPMERVYPDEVGHCRRNGSRIGEVGCLAQQGNQLSLLLRLINLVTQRARLMGISDMLIAVHPRHVKFYERYLGFSVIGPLRSYHAVCGHPAVPLAVNLNSTCLQNRRAADHLFGPPFPLSALIPGPLEAYVREQIRAWASHVPDLAELCA